MLHKLYWKASDLVNGLVPPSSHPEALLYDEPVTPVAQANRDTRYLHPLFAESLAVLLESCHEAKLAIYMFEGRRSFRRQQYLYEQGRTRKGAIVTNAQPGLSMHQWGLAADNVFVKPFDKTTQWTWTGDFAQYGEIVKEQFYKELVWAGTWQKFKEFPHVQWKTGYKETQLKAVYDQHGKGTSGLKAVWDMIDEEHRNKANGGNV